MLPKKVYIVCAPTSQDELKSFKTQKAAKEYIEENKLLFYPNLMLIKHSWRKS